MANSEFDSEAWLKRYGRCIQQYLMPRTVPIMIYDGEAGPHPPQSQGTGVLVRLRNRYFALTAGHCVEDCIPKGRKVYVGISSAPHRFCPTIARRNYVVAPKGTVDFGYIEFHSTDAITMEAKYSVFSGESRIDIRPPANAGEGDEWVIVAGYPYEEAKNTSQYLAMRFMIALTQVAREDEPPAAAVTQLLDGFSAVDLLLPPGNMVSPMPGQFQQAEPTSFSGVSGGGCWSLDVSADPDEWSINDKPRLCAIHTGTSTPVEEEEYAILRQVPVVYHLRMIAHDYPDLTADLEKQWPEIGDVKRFA